MLHQGVPPLTGDGSSFDLPLQTEQPAATGSTLFEHPAPQADGGRAFAIAGALVVGLLTGFAGGFVFGLRSGSIPAAREAAEVAPPASAPVEETFTEAAIADSAPRPVERAPAPAVVAPVVAAQSSARPAPLAPPEPLAPASIAFASRPEGAQVFLDGVAVGRTPLVVPDVKAGTRRVRLELAGHRTWTTVVNVEPGTRARVGASLER